MKGTFTILRKLIIMTTLIIYIMERHAHKFHIASLNYEVFPEIIIFQTFHNGILIHRHIDAIFASSNYEEFPEIVIFQTFQHGIRIHRFECKLWLLKCIFPGCSLYEESKGHHACRLVPTSCCFCFLNPELISHFATISQERIVEK